MSDLHKPTGQGWFYWSTCLIARADELSYENTVTLFTDEDHPIIATRVAYDNQITALIDKLETEIYKSLARG